MGLITKENQKVALFLLPELVELAKKHDGLCEPDKGTEQIMLRCIGTGFALGVAYSKTRTLYSWRERLRMAFQILKKQNG